MKRKKIIIGVAFLFVLLGVCYFTGNQVGLLGTTVQTYPDSVKLSNNIAEVLQATGLENISQYQDAVDELDIQLYGVNDKNAFDTISWYVLQNSQEGWDVIKDDHITGNNWDAYIYAWQKTLGGRAVIAVDGILVKTLTGYDTVVITSNAPIWVYEKYVP